MSSTIETAKLRLQQAHTRITAAAEAAGRPLEDIRLIVVSKTRPVADLLALQAAGQNCFGESYLQEALVKIEAMHNPLPEWHFIGPIQSNKTRAIAESFGWVHSVSRASIIKRLNQQRPAHLPPLNICLQVNISAEAAKSGCSPQQLPNLAQRVRDADHLRLRGLMAVPVASDQISVQRRSFRQLRELYDQLQTTHGPLDTLSMGMSNDLEAAILEGATHLRIGTAIFGPRHTNQD
ncbi:MAG TPA: YggS family pyridoxal phosphate-dependent enzyme [Gammaproteobacteria bacterium]|nr:YggS family pyridoxal phosphate-dependent enzyme [Gammaproteobacteria bacterium]